MTEAFRIDKQRTNKANEIAKRKGLPENRQSFKIFEFGLINPQ